MAMARSLNKFSFFNYSSQISTKINIDQFKFKDNISDNEGIGDKGNISNNKDISNKYSIGSIGGIGSIGSIGSTGSISSTSSISSTGSISNISDISDKSNKSNKKHKLKKKQIPKHIKTLIWNKYIGDDIIKHKCLCCKQETIRNTDFEAGHVLSEHHGGSNEISNLRPICRPCNASMGTMHMVDYIKKYGLYI